jgi:hypothetical protein
MKRALLAVLVTGLAAAWVGCQASVNDSTSSEFTLVNLKVPNMT